MEHRIKANVPNKKDDYSLIIKKIKRTISESKHGLLTSKEQLEKSVLNQLERVLIGDHHCYITINKSVSNTFTISFELSNNLYLEYTDKPNSANEYKKVGCCIETKKINNHWIIWKDNDFI